MAEAKRPKAVVAVASSSSSSSSSAAVAVDGDSGTSSKDQKRPSSSALTSETQKKKAVRPFDDNGYSDGDDTEDEDFFPSSQSDVTAAASGDSDAEEDEEETDTARDDKEQGRKADAGEEEDEHENNNGEGEEDDGEGEEDDDDDAELGELHEKVHPLFNFAQTHKEAREWAGGSKTSHAFDRHDFSNRMVMQVMYVSQTGLMPIWTNDNTGTVPAVFAEDQCGSVKDLMRFAVAAERSATSAEFERKLNLGLEEGHAQFLRLDKLPIRYAAFYSEWPTEKKAAIAETRDFVFAASKKVHRILQVIWTQLRAAAADHLVLKRLRQIEDALLVDAISARIASCDCSFNSDDALTDVCIPEFSDLVRSSQLRGPSISPAFVAHWGTRENFQNFSVSYASLVPTDEALVPEFSPAADADTANEQRDGKMVESASSSSSAIDADKVVSCDQLLPSETEEKELLWQFLRVATEILYVTPQFCIKAHADRDRLMASVRASLSDVKKQARERAAEASKAFTPKDRLESAMVFLRDLSSDSYVPKALLCGNPQCHVVLQFAGAFRKGLCGACHDRKGKLLCWHHVMDGDGDPEKLCKLCEDVAKNFCISSSHRRKTEEERERDKQEKLEKKEEAKRQKKQAKAESKRQEKEMKEREKRQQKAADAVTKAQAAVKIAKSRRATSESAKRAAETALEAKLSHLAERQKNPKASKALAKAEKSAEAANLKLSKTKEKLQADTAVYNDKLALLRKAEAERDKLVGASPAPAVVASASASTSSPSAEVFVPESPIASGAIATVSAAASPSPSGGDDLPGPRPAKRRAIAPVSAAGSSSSSSPVAVPVAVAPLTCPVDTPVAIHVTPVVDEVGSKRKHGSHSDNDGFIITATEPRFIPPPPPPVSDPTVATQADALMEDSDVLPASQVTNGGFD